MGPTHTTDNHTELPSEWRVVSVCVYQFVFMSLFVFLLHWIPTHTPDNHTELHSDWLTEFGLDSCVYQLVSVCVIHLSSSCYCLEGGSKINCQAFSCSQRNIHQHHVLLSHKTQTTGNLEVFSQATHLKQKKHKRRLSCNWFMQLFVIDFSRDFWAHFFCQIVKVFLPFWGIKGAEVANRKNYLLSNEDEIFGKSKPMFTAPITNMNLRWYEYNLD